MSKQSVFLAGLAAGLLWSHEPQAAGLPFEIDNTNRWAWSEVAGWVNGKTTHGAAQVVYDGAQSYLSGYAWLENVGWLKLGVGAGPYANTAADNWGVNMDGEWRLSGYAWSETAGWINFAPTHGGVAVNPNGGGFSGYAWGENIGWIHFTNSSPAYVMQAQIGVTSNGVPQWWLWDYGVTNDFDAAAAADWDGDEAFTWEEYVAGTDPTDPQSVLALDVPGFKEQPALGARLRWQSRPDRLYTLEWGSNLLAVPPFQPVLLDAPGSNGVYTFTDTNAVAPIWHLYRLRARPAP